MDFAKMVFMYYIIIIPMKLFLHTAESYMAPITTSHLFFSIYIAKANENVVDSILLYSWYFSVFVHYLFAILVLVH